MWLHPAQEKVINKWGGEEMEYFCCVDKREGTCYHEFYRGKWDGIDFWNVNSVLLHDDMMEKTELYKAFQASIPSYYYFGETEVTKEEWHLVVEYTEKHLEKAAQAALEEIKDWVNEALETEGVFTILGI